jgi:hypothetical protein
MNSLPPQTVPIPVLPLSLAADSDEPCHLYCLNCEAPLDLHIPDPQDPDCVLGTCEECGAWFLADLAAGAIAWLPKLKRFVSRRGMPETATREVAATKPDGICAA